MKANPNRGEVNLIVNGQSCIFKLNLLALSKLESELELDSFSQLAHRFAQNQFSGIDVILILNSAYFGANSDVIKIEECHIEGGAKEAALAAIKLLKLGFWGKHED